MLIEHKLIDEKKIPIQHLSYIYVQTPLRDKLKDYLKKNKVFLQGFIIPCRFIYNQPQNL